MAAVRQPSPPLNSYKKSISICLSEEMIKRLRLHSMNINVSQSKIVESALSAMFDLYDSSQKELQEKVKK